jgi:cyclohexanone monooxygenase
MSQLTDETVYDALIIGGGGFGGLYMLHRLREDGFHVVALEAASGPGGAWYWNRYPGARCDVESLVYSFSFSPVIDAEWRWSERYAAQPEIRRYMEFVADRLDLRKDIRFNTRVTAATWDDVADVWTIRTEAGALYSARHLISATGPLSAPIMPNIPDREAYEGEFYHTALWPEQQPDFTGKRVGVIGNGSSGTQLIPLVAQQAEQLTVFIRTPNYYAQALNRPLTDADYAQWEGIRDSVRQKLRTGELIGSGDVFMSEAMLESRRRSGEDFTAEEQQEIMERRWDFGGAVTARVFADVMTNSAINDTVSDFLRGKIAAAIDDPATADTLVPSDFAYGTKRITIGTDYLETFNRPNVTAINVKQNPIERFSTKGLVIGGREIALDAIIAASGFDALTGAITAIDIRGRDGRSIKDAWADGAASYLGLGIAGFPNLHIIGGPGSPSVLVNVIMANEQQVDWIARLLGFMYKRGYRRVEALPAPQAAWMEQVRNAVRGTVMENARSWYVGANVAGKPQGILAYAGRFMTYIDACEASAAKNYEGFALE